jgi:hypothetical protein
LNPDHKTESGSMSRFLFACWMSAFGLAPTSSFIHAQGRHVLDAPLFFSVFHFVHLSARGEA